MSEELKPCPFCGRNAVATRRIRDMKNEPRRYEGYCMICNGSSTLNFEESTAIMHWNNRPIEDALRAELVRTETILAARKDLAAALTAQVAGFAGLLISIDPNVAGNEFLAILTQNVQAARDRLAEMREGGKS